MDGSAVAEVRSDKRWLLWVITMLGLFTWIHEGYCTAIVPSELMLGPCMEHGKFVVARVLGDLGWCKLCVVPFE